MSSNDKLGRRTVLRVGAAGGLALATLPLACGPDGASVPNGPVAAGMLADVQVGALERIAGEALFLGRDDGGLYAMSAVCTHAGCLVAAPAAGAASMTCPCHGSMFDLGGAAVRGPAGRPLQHYRVEVGADMSITVHGDEPVASDVRTAV